MVRFYEGREGLNPDKAMEKVEAVVVVIARYRSGRSYEACLNVCEREKVSVQNGPCDLLFNKNIKDK